MTCIKEIATLSGKAKDATRKLLWFSLPTPLQNVLTYEKMTLV
jgi:hypothetical protein